MPLPPTLRMNESVGYLDEKRHTGQLYGHDGKAVNLLAFENSGVLLLFLPSVEDIKNLGLQTLKDHNAGRSSKDLPPY